MAGSGTSGPGVGGGLPVRETQEDSVHHVQGLKSSHVAELRLV